MILRKLTHARSKDCQCVETNIHFTAANSNGLNGRASKTPALAAQINLSLPIPSFKIYIRGGVPKLRGIGISLLSGVVGASLEYCSSSPKESRNVVRGPELLEPGKLGLVEPTHKTQHCPPHPASSLKSWFPLSAPRPPPDAARDSRIAQNAFSKLPRGIQDTSKMASKRA